MQFKEWPIHFVAFHLGEQSDAFVTCMMRRHVNDKKWSEAKSKVCLTTIEMHLSHADYTR